MPKQKGLLILGASLLVIALVIALSLIPETDQGAPMPDDREPSAKSSDTKRSVSREAATASNSSSPDFVPQQTDAAREKILEEIQDAAVTYEATGLSKIEPYLLHSDPEIRLAAKDGMITLGDASAGPLLRKAAALAPTPQEAVALLEAADYVELPPAKLRRRPK